MTTSSQKELEKIYAAKVANLLGESWEISGAEDEENWPDLNVDHQGKKFGVEVREIFLDEAPKKGSRMKSDERFNIKALAKIAEMYYQQSDNSISVNTLGSFKNVKQILLALLATAESLKELDQARVEVGKDCVAYVRRLPGSFGKYTRWTHVPDRTGWVHNLDLPYLEHQIAEKATKLEKYQRNHKEVRLLLVANRMYNSGKISVTNIINVDGKGFAEVYLLSYPDSVIKLCS